MTVDRTHSITYKRNRLPELPEAAITAAAEKNVWDVVNASATEEVDGQDLTVEVALKRRVVLASALAASAKATIDELNPVLMATCLSYSLNDAYSGVWRAAGYSPTWYKAHVRTAMKALGEGTPPAYVADAHLRIMELAPQVAEARATRAVAVNIRDDAMLKLLLEHGIKRNDVAALAGIGGTRLSNIKRERERGAVEGAVS